MESIIILRALRQSVQTGEREGEREGGEPVYLEEDGETGEGRGAGLAEGPREPAGGQVRRSADVADRKSVV